MNANRAREYFSAYYEGELEGGLRQSFEASLASDDVLRADYASFCEAMGALQSLAEEPLVAEPSDLHDRIMARFDHHVWEEKRSAKSVWWGDWKLALFGGLSVVALAAAMFSIGTGGGATGASTAGIVNVEQASATVSAAVRDGQPSVRAFLPRGTKLVARRYSTANELWSEVGEGGTVEMPLTNESATAERLEILISRDGGELKREFVMVLPGSAQGEAGTGEGTVIELASAMADLYRTPIVLRVSDPGRAVRWQFDAGWDFSARAQALSGERLSLSLLDEGGEAGLALLTDASR